MPPKRPKSRKNHLGRPGSNHSSHRNHSRSRYPLRNHHSNDEDDNNSNIGDISINTEINVSNGNHSNVTNSSDAGNDADQSSSPNNSASISDVNATNNQTGGGEDEETDVASAMSNQSARIDKLERSIETLTQILLEDRDQSSHQRSHPRSHPRNQRSTNQNSLNSESTSTSRDHYVPSRHNHTRQTLDLPLLEMTYQGSELINSPVLLQDGDSAYWRYSGDLIRHVTILETTMPTLLRRMPIYHFKCENGQEYDDRHDKLFISKEEALEIDPNGVIRSSRSPTTALEDLDLTAIDSDLPDHIKKQWEQLDPEKFKLATLSTSIKDYKLSNDSIVAIKRLMNFLSQSVTGASKTGLLKLPSIRDLTPTTTIRDLWLSPPSHPRFDKANACYLNIASCFALLFESEDFASNAPKAQLAIASVIGGTTDGIDVLDHLLKSRIPALGATDFDAYETIAALQVEDGMLLIKFLSAAQDIQSQLSLSSHAAEDNSLFKQFLTELMKTNIHSFIGSIFGDFNRFNKLHGNVRKYSSETIDSVARFLIDGKAPDVLRLNDRVTDTSTRDVNDASPFKQAYIRHKSRSNFSRPKFASMSIKSAEQDDSTVDNDLKLRMKNSGKQKSM